MIFRNWTVSACIADEKEIWLCKNIFGREVLPGEDRILRENISLFTAIRIYFILSGMGVLSMFYKT